MFCNIPAQKRGQTQVGWLTSYHTFPFGLYQNANLQNFGVLRAINDNTFSSGGGTNMHPQSDMEMLCIILDGRLEHKDSLGQKAVLKTGDIQLTSAGKEIYHSELNASHKQSLRFLQIWILPSAKGLTPSYDKKRFSRSKLLNKLCLIASPRGEKNSLCINQNCKIFRSLLNAEKEISFLATSIHQYWLHIISGSLDINGELLSSGDGFGIKDETLRLKLRGCATETDFLLFELPAQ